MKPAIWLLAAILIATHLFFALSPGNNINTKFSGGGDEARYALVAHNLITGHGYGYADKPTAFRAPLYTLLIAAAMRVSPNSWPLLIRMLQFFASILTGVACGVLAMRWFGDHAGIVAFLLALAMPTLLFFTGELLTECFAALLGILFFLYLDKCMGGSRASDYWLLGLIAGLGTLERFNFVAFAAIGCLLVLTAQGFKRAFLVGAVCLLTVSPWLIRNAIAFGGFHAVLSTNNGASAVQGVLEPFGRTQPGETEIIQKATGWEIGDVETNTPKRPELRDEVALNRQAWAVTLQLWEQYKWKLIPIEAEKLGAFWFGLDQVAGTGALPMRSRLLRWIGVGAYWAVLAMASFSLWKLYRTNRQVASALLFLMVTTTWMHLPLNMSTRLRVPLFDPLLCTLAAWFYLKTANVCAFRIASCVDALHSSGTLRARV